MSVEILQSSEGQVSRKRKSGEILVRVNVLVPASVRKEWKAAALASDKTLTDLIIAAMRKQVTPTHNN